MKQITMNGTANALQVAAVIFLFGNSFIAPDKNTKQIAVSNSNVKQDDVKKENVMGTYLHSTISASPFNKFKTTYAPASFTSNKSEAQK